jgi:LPXTG-motif cell wall-anchored protein
MVESTSTALIILGVYLLAGAAAWAWVGWRRRRRRRARAPARRQRQEYPLLTGFLLLLTWPLAVWEEVQGRKK